MFDPNPSQFITADQDKRAGETAAYVHSAGFAGNDLVTALAVAYAESGWNYKAKGGPNKNGTYDWGLFQINDVHKPSESVKTNPLANAREAFRIYRAAGAKFTPWASYNSGAYKAHLAAANAAVKSLQSRGSDFERETVANAEKGDVSKVASPGELNSVGSGIASPLDLARTALAKFMQFFDVSLAVLIGLVVLVLGIVILSRGTASKLVGGVAKDMMKTGKAAKTVATSAPAKVGKTVEERAADSLALADAKKAILEQRKQAATDKARADFLAGFQERQAAYRKARGQ